MEDKETRFNKINKFLLDGWENLIKGFNGNKDTTKHNTFGDFEVISDLVIASIFAGDGWGSNIATMPAEDAVSEWVSFSDDKDKKIEEKLEELDVQDIFKIALTWQRLFRGGLIWMISTKKSTDVYKEGVKQDIKKLKVFSASEVRVESFYTSKKVIPGENVAVETNDPLKIGEVKTFRILKNEMRSEDIIVDSSQCLILKSGSLPSVPSAGFDTLFQTSDVSVREYLYWGIGELQRVNVQLSRYGILEAGMGQISTELIVAIYKIAGLKEILQSDDGFEKISKRMSIIDAGKSMVNAVFLDADANEEFNRNTINLAGVGDLWDKFMMTISGVTRIPASKLFGRQASGLNNKGEQDERNYNKYIHGIQKSIVKEPLQKLLSTLTGKQIPFTFASLWAPSQQELIAMRKTQADTDDKYVQMQALSADEVRESRFTGTYSFETKLSEGIMVGEDDDDVDVGKDEE